MIDLAPSRRFSVAKALASIKDAPDLELSIAIIEWKSRETDATVRGELERALPPLKPRA